VREKDSSTVHKRFLQECRKAVHSLEAVLPEHLSPETRTRVALDLVLRMLFLRLAETAGHRTERPDRFTEVLYGSAEVRGPLSVVRRLLPLPTQVACPGAPPVSDEALRPLLGETGFLDRYAFSAQEDPGHDSVILGPAVLAELIETLAPGRRDRGAFFTPPEVVDFVVRAALMEWLGDHPELIIDSAGSRIPPARRAEIIGRLADLTVLDPACGGGAFLLGTQRILRSLGSALDAPELPTARRLYGADIDPQAVGVARLRLWLSSPRPTPGPDVDLLISQAVVADTLSADPPYRDRRCWHLVLTNPPYGVKVPPATRDRIIDPRREGAQSRDAYGLFLANAPRLLTEGGVAGLVVADTWRTIASHLPLRRRLLAQVQIRRIVDLPAGTFKATVGAEIVILRNAPPDPRTPLQAVDLRAGAETGLAERLRDLLRAPHPSGAPAATGRYVYPQSRCRAHRRHPVFIASPALFRFLMDPSMMRIGEIADVRHGLTTGDTRRFIYRRPGAPGRYPIADPERIVEGEDLAEWLTEDERQNGFNPDRLDGRYLVPCDKGGASRTADGWLPCYQVPTDYYIDWRAESVAAMKRLPGFRHDGREYYFRRGVTFSHTGQYAPTFRFGAGGVFDTAGSTLFPRGHDLRLLLALLNSSMVRYLFKNYLNHSVNAAENPLKEIPLPRPDAGAERDLILLVDRIAARQRTDRYYPFHRHEQREIDALVFGLYGLAEEEIEEVERWCVRRYPALQGPRRRARSRQ